MKVSVLKMTFRSIRGSVGRFAALFLIVALGAGFFAGLKLTQPDMQETLDTYLNEYNMYDFRLISTVGFTGEDIDAIGEISGVAETEGAYSQDALLDFEGNIKPYSVHSIPEEINKLQLISGSFPENENECVVDADFFDESDIGKTITVSDENTEAVAYSLSETEYTIVGLVESPLYISRDRGTTTLADGSIYAFIYIMPESFAYPYYSEIYVTLTQEEFVYSDAYDDLISEYEPEITAACDEQTTYILTRSENSGYVSFENDTAIVSGIANVFPVFFIMIGMLVCMTTMGRMVVEERTQIGVLKALGLSDATVIVKYMLYVGIATFAGWLFGYAVCTLAIPQIFWIAYEKLYNFSSLKYQFNLWNMLGTFLVSMVCTLGSTYYSCMHSLHESPARLIRPKTPKNGRRIFLERIGILWNRLSFMHKVTIRNMFLSGQRFWMMIIGISGCTALLVTGFGVKDSMPVTGKLQYEDVHKYDIKAELADAADISWDACSYKLIEELSVDVIYENDSHSAKLWAMTADDVGDYLWMADDGTTLDFPEAGEVILSRQTAEDLGIETGDTITVRDADMESCELVVSGIFDNYLNSYAVINTDTIEGIYGVWEPTSALINADGDVSELADDLLESENVTGITLISDRRELLESSLECLDYIILMIIFFAGALAFVVIFNLTNINLAERNREVATVKVLGFYPRETASYILHENIILSVMACIIGLPLGILLHSFVLGMIEIDGILFPCIIEPESYVYAFLLTIIFAILVNLYMRRQIEKIHMAESLKSVE